MATRRRNRLELLGWSGVAIAAVLAVVFGTRLGGGEPTLVGSPLIGQPVAALELPTIDGSGSYGFGDQTGEIMVVTFFASWCAPCREEQPSLVAAANQFAGEVEFVGILYQDQPENAIAFFNEYGFSDFATYVSDPESRAAIEFGLFGIPETFFIDKNGIIVGKVSGGVTLPLLLSTIETIDSGEIPGEASTGETFQAPG